MTKLALDLKKTVEQNASDYFEKAKKFKKKIEGAKKAIDAQKKNLIILEKEAPKADEKSLIEKRKKAWYEKFKWFITSDGFLCVGGRDATSNEIIVKKHTEKNDLLFHTDMAGSPFVVLKISKEKPTDATLQEVADFVCVHSKAWKLGMASTPVFYVTPDQVTKEANTGEYLSKGSFVIRGKTIYLTPTMNYAIGVYNNAIMGGPINAIKKHCEQYFEIVQGNEKTSDVAKIIQKKLGVDIDLDDIISALPPNSKLMKTQSFQDAKK